MLFSPPKTWSLASWGDSSVLYCTSCAADRNHIVRRIYAPSFLEHGLVFQWMDLVKRVWWSWALERAQLPMFVIVHLCFWYKNQSL